MKKYNGRIVANLGENFEEGDFEPLGSLSPSNYAANLIDS